LGRAATVAAMNTRAIRDFIRINVVVNSGERKFGVESGAK
jgi:hypothetical protein